MTLNITNTEKYEAPYSISVPAWISQVIPAEGNLSPSQSQTISLTVDRTALSGKGVFTSTITVHSGDRWHKTVLVYVYHFEQPVFDVPLSSITVNEGDTISFGISASVADE